MNRIHEAAGLLRFVLSHPANRGRPLSALARFIGWQAWKRVTQRPCDLWFEDGYRLRAWPDSTVASLMIYCGGRPDWNESRFLLHLLRPGDGFVDVGAHIGTYSLLAAARVGPTGWVEAFEPSSDSARRFRCNLRLNDFTWVTLHEAAVGQSSGTVRFTTGLNAMNQIANHGDMAGIEVPQVKLDEILAGRRPAAAKLDIEGAEPLALAGWDRSLRQGSPMALLIEVNDGIRRFGFHESELAKWLAERDYRLGLYDSDRRLIEWCAAPWTRRENILAVYEPSLPEVLRRIQSEPVAA